jgi:hypothetical protein
MVSSIVRRMAPAGDRVRSTRLQSISPRPQTGHRPQQPDDEFAHAVQVLGVVDHEQQLVVAQAAPHTVHCRLARRGLDPDHGADRGGYQRRLAYRCQLDHERAVGHLVGERPRDLERQPRLAQSARTDEGDQPPVLPTQETDDVRQLALPSEQGRQSSRDGGTGPFRPGRRGESGVVAQDGGLQRA